MILLERSFVTQNNASAATCVDRMASTAGCSSFLKNGAGVK